MNMHPIKIMIADDHTLVTEMWSALLDQDDRLKIVATTVNGEETLSKVQQVRPDVLLLDIELPDMSGIDVVKMVRKYSPGTRVIGVSMHTQPAYLKKMMRNGAVGYVSKTSSREEMLKAIFEVASGKTYICQQMQQLITQNVIENEIGGNKPTNGNLTLRELEVIRQIEKGHSSKEIAELFNVSQKTVEMHRYNIFKKLGVKSSLQMLDHVRTNLLLE